MPETLDAVHLAVLEQVVKIRAAQLKTEGTGYLKAITKIADEL